MTPELKANWIEALRSGRYTQADGYLNCQSGFCCLGVLLDVAYPDRWTPYSHSSTEGVQTHTVADNSFDLGETLDDFGLTADESNVLIDMNDGGSSDFNAIADWIEANVSTS